MKLGGTAVVCCVHDREKNVVRTVDDLAEIGASVGIELDATIHKIHSCTCCANLFVDESDLPMYCYDCRRPAIHAVMAPLPEPKGAMS